jgi:signal transduction histidine kinase
MTDPILLVDDEPGIRKVLSITLNDSGYDVISAADGQEALELFKKHRPSIVLTDIKMPGMDGIELLQALKAEDSEVEVIMITGHGDMDLAINSLKNRATDFITKPINDDILEIALKRARERIQMRGQLRDYMQNLETLVKEKTNELIQAERLAAVGQTVTELSHAIKNIAGGLEAGMFVIEKGLELNEETYKGQGWDMIRDNVEKIKDLSLDLLKYSRPEDLRLQDCDPNKPAREVLDLMQAKARKMEIELVQDLADHLSPVQMDPDEIHRCLLNLVTNAVEAFEEETEPQGARQIKMSTSAQPGWGVVYQVTDTGPGMTDQTLGNLFTRFFTTKGGRGTGLGLMLTKRIVEAHGGEIEAESKPGQGATFTIRLP